MIVSQKLSMLDLRVEEARRAWLRVEHPRVAVCAQLLDGRTFSFDGKGLGPSARDRGRTHSR